MQMVCYLTLALDTLASPRGHSFPTAATALPEELPRNPHAHAHTQPHILSPEGRHTDGFGPHVLKTCRPACARGALEASAPRAVVLKELELPRLAGNGDVLLAQQLVLRLYIVR
jgi:hypothetical protein